MDDLQQLEQGLATVAENFPPAWKRIYDNCVREGFTELQAFRILLTYVSAMAGGRLELPP